MVFKDADAETGASNHRKLCVMTADKESKFDVREWISGRLLME